MMKVFICPDCGWVRLVSRRSVVECHKCGNKQMKLCNLSMKEYTDMSEEERENYLKGWMYIQNRKTNN
ncbi:MAG: DNA-directed RNA polymerase subunit M [Agathobacter sp.]|nr:DNA-directed RNA polymerase subunit M [Agathobacter sp.]